MARGVYVGKERNPFLVFLFGLITAFIYTFYWFYAANREMQKRGIERAKPALYVVLAVIPVIQVLAVHRTVTNLRKIYLGNNVPRDPSPWALAVLCLPLPYIGLLFASSFVQSGLNHVWEETRARVIEDGPEVRDLHCMECEAVFEIRKNPYSEGVVRCPSCAYEGVVS
ncbi:MAG: hypothetical protein KY455_13525 [Euryarchaeota archaeon]|nr:hypothetical protein [Euryarchaeota archaeon]